MGFTDVVEQLSFSLFLLILAFDFDLMLGSFFSFWALTGYFWGWGRVQKMLVGRLMYVCMFPSFLIFDFYLILGSFLTVLGPWGYFWGLGRVRQLFWGLLM